MTNPSFSIVTIVGAVQKLIQCEEDLCTCNNKRKISRSSIRLIKKASIEHKITTSEAIEYSNIAKSKKNVGQEERVTKDEREQSKLKLHERIQPL